MYKKIMEIGVSTGFADRLGVDVYSALDIVKDTPIKILELWTIFYGKKLHFDWDDKTELEKIKNLISKYKLTIHSIHAPFSYEYELATTDLKNQKKVLEDTKKIISVATEFNAKVVVVHPASKPDTSKKHLTTKEYHEKFTAIKNAMFELAEFITKNNFKIKVALENQLPHIMCGYPEELIELIESVDKNIFGVCFDTGHSELTNSYNAVCSMMNLLKQYLIATHISDTDGKSDDHLAIGEGKIRWHCVYEILQLIKFQQPFMLEILTPINGMDIKSTLIEAYSRANVLFKEWG